MKLKGVRTLTAAWGDLIIFFFFFIFLTILTLKKGWLGKKWGPRHDRVITEFVLKQSCYNEVQVYVFMEK